MAVPSLNAKQARQRGALKMANAALYGSASVLFAGWFAADWSWPVTIAASVLAGLACAVVSGWLPEDYSHQDGLDQSDDGLVPEDRDGPTNEGLLPRIGDTLFSAALVSVIGVAVLLFTFFPPIAIVSAIALLNGASFLGFVSALGATLAAAFVFEFGVAYPLDKRWRLGVFA